MWKRNGHLVGLAAAAGLLMAACEPVQQPAGQESAEPGTLERLTQETNQAIDRTEEVAREQSNRFIEQAEARLRDMREQLADARKREDVPEETRDRFHAAAEQLEKDIANLEQKLRHLRDQGEGAWHDVEPRLRSAIEDLSASFKRFRDTHLTPR